MAYLIEFSRQLSRVGLLPSYFTEDGAQAQRPEIIHLRSQLTKVSLEWNPLECGPEAKLLNPQLLPAQPRVWDISLHTLSAPYSTMTLGQSSRQPRAESTIFEGGGTDSGPACPADLNHKWLPEPISVAIGGLPDSGRRLKSLQQQQQQQHGIAQDSLNSQLSDQKEAKS